MRLHQNVETWERVASLAIGLSLVGLAAQRRKFLDAKALTGYWFVARGASGFCPVNAAVGRKRRRDDTRTALGGSRGIRLDESIRINRPREEVFAFWRNLGNLPHFMQHVERVDEIDGRLSHWVVRGPGNMRFEWDAEIVNEIEPELIGWRSLEGADVATAGSVKFNDAGSRATEVVVTLQYDPPGGKAGAALSSLVGQDPGRELRDDLAQLKRVLEGDGRSPEPWWEDARPFGGLSTIP